MKNDNSSERNTGALELSPQQQEVLSALRSRETDRFHVSHWYLGALYALNNPYNPDRIAQAAQSLRELIEKLPRVLGIGSQSGSHGFKGWRNNLRSRFQKDKKKYAQGWKGHSIDSHLDKTLAQFDNYLERNQQSTRSEQIQESLARIDPLARLLDKELRDEKRDQLFHLWDKFEGFAHHKLDSDLDEFMRSLEALERIVIDLLAPITAQDQQEILSILNLPDTSESDVSRLLTLIKRRGANYSFFFEHVSDAAWIPILEREGYFSHPPSSEPIDEDRSEFPIWIPVKYLSKVAKDAPSEVARILSNLPPVDNPWVYGGILDAALNLSGSQSARLLNKMMEYTRLDFHFLAHRFPSLLNHWTAESQTSAALKLSEVLIQFEPDPKAREKRDRYRKDSSDWLSGLNPSPRFENWDYREILNSGVRPLAEKEPYKTACLLINAVARMNRLKYHPEQLERDSDEDTSQVWCRRLGGEDSGYGDKRKILADTLTFACEQVFEGDPDSIPALDNRLRNQRWKIFKRLRQHLYARYPSEQTKPWIQEEILNHPDYGEWEHTYEFQHMIRRACEHFGSNLLSEKERRSIFNTILSGPPKEEYQESRGESFTEDWCAERQNRFHRVQFGPFAPVLLGKYLLHFQELEDGADAPISEADYDPSPKPEAGFISRRSPISLESFTALNDEDKLAYLNEWENEHRDPDDWLVEYTFEALAGVFQSFFMDLVDSRDEEFRYWVENRGRIERPIYVRAMIEGMEKRVEERKFDRLDEFLEFCEWVLSHPDRAREGKSTHGDQSRENPNWARSREAVGRLIHTCVREDVNVPKSAQRRLANLLEALCTQFDWQLDRDDPEFLDRHDQFAVAFDHTRSWALEYLFEFGGWLQRNDPGASVGAVKSILEKRYALESALPLTLPERAILGSNFVRLLGFDEAWALEHRSDFFPQSKPHHWREAFGGLLRRHGPNIRIFEALQEEYLFAAQHLAGFRGRDDSDREYSDHLGRHLFFYYLWGLFPLKGKDSLLECFYQGTENDRKRWSNLVDHLGFKLGNTKEGLDEDLKRGLAEFFEWRLEAGDIDELVNFSSWLKAECLEAEWRLDAQSRVLGATKGLASHAVWVIASALEEMLPQHTSKVVECFAKLTDGTNDSTFYIDDETAQPIIRAGLDSSDEDTKANAERARENLLRRGYFDLLNLQD